MISLHRDNRSKLFVFNHFTLRFSVSFQIVFAKHSYKTICEHTAKMHYSSKYCEDEPAEKKPKIEDGAVSRDDGANSHGATGTNSRDGDAREHPIPRATRVMQAAAMTNPPRVGHLILHQHQIDELLGEKITWNKFRKTCLKVENNLVYIRHYRYNIICDRLCVFD